MSRVRASPNNCWKYLADTCLFVKYYIKKGIQAIFKLKTLEGLPTNPKD